MEKDKKVTALYCRLSKDDGSNSESLSIRTQKAMLMEYATRNGFGNCQYYVDGSGHCSRKVSAGRMKFRLNLLPASCCTGSCVTGFSG